MSADETAHLADFELARDEQTGATSLTTTTSPKGTWRFISPEMRSGAAPKPSSAADMYAYGVCALLTSCEDGVDCKFDDAQQLQPDWSRAAAKENGGAHLPSLLEGLLDLGQPPAPRVAEARDRRLSAREVLRDPYLNTTAEREQARREAEAAAEDRRAVDEEEASARRRLSEEAAVTWRRLDDEAARERRRLHEEEQRLREEIARAERAQRQAAALVERDQRAMAERERKVQQRREQHKHEAGELAAKKAELAQLDAETTKARKQLDEGKRKAEEERKKLKAEQAKLERLGAEKRQPPAYWQRAFAQKSPDGFALLNIDPRKQPGVWRALQQLLLTEHPHELGKGRDAQPGKPYNQLKLATAWRLEHPALWEAYTAGQRKVIDQMKRIKTHGKQSGRVRVRTEHAASELPSQLCAEANESVLLHGAPPAAILSIISTGANERFSGSNAGTAFGDGSCASTRANLPFLAALSQSPPSLSQILPRILRRTTST